MDIQQEKWDYTAMLVAENAITQEQCDTLKLSDGINMFYSDHLASTTIDCINWGWSSWLKAKAKAIPDGFVLIKDDTKTVVAIEQLGGYEKAKEELKIRISKGFVYSVIESEEALLEYRRQHSIFKVGDKVVAPILHGYFVGKIIAYRSDIDRFDVMGSRHWGWFFAHQLKHATDAEIKAGKRLKVT